MFLKIKQSAKIPITTFLILKIELELFLCFTMQFSFRKYMRKLNAVIPLIEAIFPKTQMNI